MGFRTLRGLAGLLALSHCATTQETLQEGAKAAGGEARARSMRQRETPRIIGAWIPHLLPAGLPSSGHGAGSPLSSFDRARRAAPERLDDGRNQRRPRETLGWMKPSEVFSRIGASTD